MERIVTREIVLTEEELAEAVLYYLINKHDVQVGEAPRVWFGEFTPECTVSSRTSDEVEL